MPKARVVEGAQLYGAGLLVDNWKVMGLNSAGCRAPFLILSFLSGRVPLIRSI